jgi:hypothetical protein
MHSPHRPRPWLAALASVLLATPALATEPPESPVEGTWKLSRAGLGGRPVEDDVRLVVRAGQVDGKSDGGWTFTGRTAAERGGWVVSLFAEGPGRRGDSAHLAFAGQLADDQISGTVVGQRGHSGAFTMVRAPEAPMDADAEVLAAWRALPGSANGCQGMFDYFPNGGLRAFFCHASTVMPVEKLMRLSGTRIFVSGPHRAGQVDFQSEKDFGHYDLAFVAWLGRHGVPGRGDAILKAALQPIYDRNVKDLARVYLAVALRLWSDPDDFAAQAKGYTNFRNHRPDRSRFEGLDENLWVPAHAFWLRRKVDGTADAFLDVLRTLINTYDPGAVAAVTPPPRTQRPPVIIDPVRPTLSLPNKPAVPAPTCRNVLVELGHHASLIGRCKGVDEACAVTLLRAKHHPSLLSRCKPGLAPECVQTLLAKGHHPSLLSRCQGVDDGCAVKLLERGDHPSLLSNCRK